MNDGVKIILERIKTHPEEFEGFGRWNRLIDHYKDMLPDADAKILHEALSGLFADKFTQAVMKELMVEEDDDPLGKLGAAGVTLSVGQTQGLSTEQLYELAKGRRRMLQVQDLPSRANRSEPWWKRLFK